MQPNVLDISKETAKIKDLADYPALFATVCAIGGLYLIVMVWARRKDKKDALKVSIKLIYFQFKMIPNIYPLNHYLLLSLMNIRRRTINKFNQ